MKIKNRINSFVGDIYFKDLGTLKNEFIKICEEANQLFLINEIDKEKHEKIMQELFEVFSSNDFVKMADYLEYNLSKHIITIE